VRYLKWT